MHKTNPYKILFFILMGVFCVICGVYSTIFVRTYRQYNCLSGQQDRYESSIRCASKQIKKREYYLNKIIQDREFLDHVVRERLGYVQPGEILFRFDTEKAYSLHKK